MSIYGNAVGGAGMAQTYILEDEDGNEVYGVLVENETVLTATENDIRLGTTAVTGIGLTNGQKEIPAYHTTEGIKFVPAGSEFTIELIAEDRYQYTKLQALICLFNSSLSNSVATDKVCINDNVYAAGTVESLATVSTDSENKAIKLGIVNETDSPCIIRYFTYKEIY